MNKDQRENLRRLALAAGAQSWHTLEPAEDIRDVRYHFECLGEDGCPVDDCEEAKGEMHECYAVYNDYEYDPEILRFIAAANPEAVLALLARVDELESGLRKIRSIKCQNCNCGYDASCTLEE